MAARQLVGVAELALAVGSDAPPTLLDARWQLGSSAGWDAYRAGHLPGAVYVDVDRDLSAAPAVGQGSRHGTPGGPGPGGRHPLPDPAAFQAAMRRAGVGDRHPVVVYDDGGAGGAGRAWWLLGYFGHPDVRVLDGGIRAWTAAGLPTSDADLRPRPGDFTARPGQRPLLDAAGAAAFGAAGRLLDTRVPARYAGVDEPVDPVAGHIPGARNLPAAELVGAGGELLPAEQLRAGVARLGVPPGAGPLGVYCGSGVVAAQALLALEAAGIDAWLYPGSWSEWITDPDRPVATGERP